MVSANRSRQVSWVSKAGHLHVQTPHEASISVPLCLKPGSPLGSAEMRDETSWQAFRATRQWSSSFPRTLAAALSSLGSRITEYRIPAIAPDGGSQDIMQRLLDHHANGNSLDSAWIAFEDCRRTSDGHSGRLLLLTPEQLEVLVPPTADGEWLLPNGQLMTIKAATSGTSGDPYMMYPLRFQLGIAPCIDGDGVFQLFPFNELPFLAGRDRAALAVHLNPKDHARFGRRYAVLSNPKLSGRLMGVGLEFPVIPVSARAVPIGRVAVHETAVRALGLRHGELCILRPTTRTLSVSDRLGFLRDRRVIVRTRPAGDVDVGYPVARLNQEVMDVLGTCDREDIVLTGQMSEPSSRASRTAPVAEIKVRALIRREGSTIEQNNDFHAEIGLDRLPTISLDLLRRQALGVTLGSPITVRPAFGSLLATELALAMNALALGAAASVVSNNLVLAAALSSAFLFLLIYLFMRRFK